MAGKKVPVVLMPRFTTFFGAGTYLTEPIPIAAYDTAVIVIWRGSLIGTGTSFGIIFYEAMDAAGIWTPCSGTSGDPIIEAVFTDTLTKAWLRLEIVLNGTDAGVSCWAEGAFLLREK